MKPDEKLGNQVSLWIEGHAEVSGFMSDDYESLALTDSSHIVLYCESPRDIPAACLNDPRLAAVVCPTPSPFSHDANLLRTMVAEHGILAVCGQAASSLAGLSVPIRISPGKATVKAGAISIPVTSGLEGSDEALGVLVSRSAVCYRPFYLYDNWLGELIARGLELGLGELVVPGPTNASLDRQGRVWLDSGPMPATIASWILNNPQEYLSLLLALTDALRDLTQEAWESATILEESAFLDAFRTNTIVAPFVGFPLFSLTRLTASRRGVQQLQLHVSAASQVLPANERKQGRPTIRTFEAVSHFLRALMASHESERELGLTAAAVLMSDLRRLSIDQLRHDHAPFREHTRHRKLH